MLLQEILGYLFSNMCNSKKAILFYGSSNSGKSVLLNALTNIIGEMNVSNIPLQDLSNQKYLGELYGKKLNIFNELPDKGIVYTGNFKALVSETDKITAWKLYNGAFSFYNQCRLVFATNNYPQIKTPSYIDNEAFFNRLIIIPFNVSIDESKQDKELFKKLCYERDIIFSFAVDGLIRYIDNGYKFSKCNASDLALNNYKKNSNSAMSFINDRCVISKDSYIHFDKLVQAYESYCKENLFERPTTQDKKQLKSILIDKHRLTYTKINRSGVGNKHGFLGLTLKM